MEIGRAHDEEQARVKAWLRSQGITKFDPNQPRDETGKWSAEGGDGGAAPTAFVSPSVTSQTFAQAVQSLNSKEQANLKSASGFIDNKLGISSVNYPAIGAWADGAENSMMVVAPGASAEQMRAACAMKGFLADQKSVLMFDPVEGGDAFMANFDVEGSPEELHNKLLNDGLAFHTLQPLGGNKIRVHVYGSDQDTIDAIDKASAGANVHFIQGSGEFLGTAKDTGSDREQRDDARRVYEEAISKISSTGTLGGRDVGKVWNEVRDYWQSLSQAKALKHEFSRFLEQLLQAANALKKFDPDQPRDEEGKWTSGGGDGGGASEAPTAARLEGRLRGSNPSVERVNAWSDQIMARQEELDKAGQFGGPEDTQLQRMSGAVGLYLRVKSGIVPSTGKGFNFVYKHVEDLKEGEEPPLEAAIASGYDAVTKVARLEYDGGVTRDAHMAVIQDAVIRCEGEGAKRVEANMFADDEDQIKLYEDLGFSRGGETAGVITMYRGEATTPEEIEGVKRREQENRERRAAAIIKSAQSVAKDMDFDASKISLGSNEDPHVDFTLNGREFKAAGVAYNAGPNKGTIKLFPDQISTWGDAAERVTAHEIKHVKFQNAMDRFKSEAETARGTIEGAIFNPDGTMIGEYAEKYPVFNLMHQTFEKYQARDWAQTDGVSDYSKEYWKQYEEKGPLYYPLAVNETLAEMAAIKYTKGTFPGHMAMEGLSAAAKKEGITRWRDLYRAVEKVYQMGRA